MKFLIIGYGAIGKRHARNIRALGHEVVLLRHTKTEFNNEGLKEYYSLAELLAEEGKPSGAIVCSPTANHLGDVVSLVEGDIPFLLEKPPAESFVAAAQMASVIKEKGFHAYDIGYNLRYHPILRFVKEYLPCLGKIYSTAIYVGYYLPYWRTGVDYRETSSAKRELGGGVHIELAHDFDYTLWFFGPPAKVVGYVAKISALEISTEDICSAMLRYDDGSVTEIHLDYLSRKYLRGGKIIADKGTLEWEWNPHEGRVLFSGEGRRTSEELFTIGDGYDFNSTYMEELDRFIGIIEGKEKGLVDMEIALATMAVIGAVEASSREERWVEIESIMKTVRV